MGPRDQKRSSWLFGWLSHLTQRHHPETVVPGLPDTCAKQLTPSPSSPSSASSSPVPSHHRYVAASLLPSERRNSQQTISSSVFSDDQYSSSSCHRRDSNERSVLYDLWSKARRHHPHYPRFRWPHSRRHPHHSHHHHHHLANDRSHNPATHRPHSLTSGSNPPSRRPSHDDGQPTLYRHRPISLAAVPHHDKRISITSLIGDQHTPNSLRPLSDYGLSQPASPYYILTDDDDLDNDPYSLEPRPSDRWVVKHDLVRLAMDGLFCSPHTDDTGVEDASSEQKHILQVGCGDGGWGIEVALTFPRWSVVGVDDGDGGTAPNRRMMPRNFKFIRRALLDGLKRLPDDTFDLVHCRFLILSHSFDDYQELVKECWRVCRPGGWIELMEMDMRIYHSQPWIGSTTQTLNSEVVHLMESRSLDPRLARRLHDLVSIDSKANYTSLPLGVWGGRLGVMFRDDVHDLIESLQPAISECQQVPCRTDQDMEDQLEMMDHELELQRAFMNLHYCYAQKEHP